MRISDVHQKQKEYFNSNETKNIGFRIEQLKKVKHLLRKNEQLLYEAINKDFSKSEFETYASELSLVYDEINTFISKIGSWSRQKRVATNLPNFPARSYIIPEPLGVCLIIGAWNYPYQLSLIPAITALAAGNTVILKPSELPLHTSNAMAKIINENFKSDYFHVLEGGVKETTEILEFPFDKIFFTGSTQVGRIIYQAAAKHLCPVTLELGGKSPAFVFSDADIAVSARRIAWSKFLNAGQTCVAPDYILVEKSIETKFLEALKKETEDNYSQKEIQNNFSQIIDLKNFKRLDDLLKTGEVYFGGNTDEENRFISPTIMSSVHFHDTIMKDEIFGPLLPVIAFDNLEEVIEKVKNRPKPLSLYIYSKNRKIIKKLLQELSFGGGAINDSVMHLANIKLPFGGVGASGMGNYHGKYGFDSFSHFKSILHKSLWFETKLKYSPYSDFKFKVIKWLMG